MRCTKPIRLSHLNHVEYPDGLLVPCGKCLACRIARRQEWSMRCLHELSQFRDAVFVTLTYNNENLPVASPSAHRRDLGNYNFPVVGTLVVDHLQKFFKRLRKEVSSRAGFNKIRYYACGEYGDNFGRPHYHAIIFGLSLRKPDKDIVKAKWPYGCVYFGTATAHSISYVAQYIDKKYTGDKAEDEYYDKGRAPIFKICSLGIGKQFLLENREQLVQMGYCTVGGRVHSFPRYYLEKLGIDMVEYRNDAKFRAAEAYEEATGLNLDPDIAYRVRPADEVRSYQIREKQKREQAEVNTNARLAAKRRKL